MQYLTTVQTAKKWGISLGRVLKLVRDNRIVGAKQFGNRWMIPDNALKPTDNRTKEGKSAQNSVEDFRFFLYSTKDINSFIPPLTDEEKFIKKAFYTTLSCRFDDALLLLDSLPIESKNRYTRIYALYCACVICFINNKPYKFLDFYSRLTLELQADFPYKKEISLLLLELEAILGKTSQIEKELYFESSAKIHPQCLPHLSSFIALSSFYSGGSGITPQIIQSLELNCAFIENLQDEEVDLQTIHIYLGVLNEMINNQPAKEYHFLRAFEIAEKRNFYWLPSMQYLYLGASFDAVLQKCSPNVIEKIHKFSSDIQTRRETFMNSISKCSIFDLLPKKKYLYVNYAMHGFVNKEIAKLMNVSEKTVEKNYSMIYEKLGVNSKKELIDYMRKIESTNK